jgi:hypothetical protein
LQKLTTLPFQKCQHRVSSLDAQPSVGGGVLVFVTGQLLPEGETNPLKFSQTFHLMPVGGSFVVTNGEERGLVDGVVARGNGTTAGRLPINWLTRALPRLPQTCSD